MKANPLNTLAVWLPMKSTGIDIKPFPSGYLYTIDGVLKPSTDDAPIYRYAKNYKLKGKPFSLIIISDDPDVKRVEAWLDERSKDITEDQVVDSFNLLEVRYGQDG